VRYCCRMALLHGAAALAQQKLSATYTLFLWNMN
jgi:hypothetical protein